MTADEERNAQPTSTAPQHAVDLANALGAGTLPPRLLDRGRRPVQGPLHRGHVRRGPAARPPLPPHEVRVRAASCATRPTVPWRVYRPAIVVGHSQTGEMDKIDGPYYFFKAIQRIRHALPEWLPLVGLELGETNIVPVDYVAAAMDHIAHQRGLDGQAFHLADPKPQRSGDALNTFARAGHAPQIGRCAIDKRVTDVLPKGVAVDGRCSCRRSKDIRRRRAGRLRHPGVARAHGADRRVRRARHRSARWRARASRCRRWSATPTSCGTTGSATSTPTCSRTARFERRGQRQDGGDHGRLVGHRRGDRAEDRRSRRDPDPRGPQRGQARGDQGGIERPAAPPTSTRATSPTRTSVDRW